MMHEFRRAAAITVPDLEAWPTPGRRYRLEFDPARRLRLTVLDTFDWRIWQDGGRLLLESESGRHTLRWQPRGAGDPYAASARSAPRWAADLPVGFLRRRLTPVLGVRAALPLGEATISRTVLRLVDRAGNVRARATCDIITPLTEKGKPADEPTALWRLERAGADPRPVQRLASMIDTAVGLGEPVAEPVALVVRSRGREPGDYASRPDLPLDPDEPTSTALGTLLAALADVAARNVDGVVADTDIEFLHDLRVASRRARSLLGEVKKVLPIRRLRPLVRELRWLGAVTGPCRDLDVFLLDLEGDRSLLPADAAGQLAPVVDLVRRDRTAVHRRLVRSLRSRRFVRLADRWAATATWARDGAGAPASAGDPVGEVAGRRIRRAYRRILTRGERLPDPPPAEALHRLRIDAKKLRYLLELFGGLYPPKRLERLVKRLRRLQDLLGEHNDLAVQRSHLEEISRRLDPAGGGAQTLLTLGRLLVVLEQRQAELQCGFAERFDEFAGDRVRAELSQLLGRKV